MESWLYSIILGIVQGIAEFLPISSSAHLVIASSLLQDGTPLSLSQNIGLHIGTLLSVLIFFRKDWLGILSGVVARLRGTPNFEADKLLPALLVGSIPAGIIGITLQDKIEEYLHHPLSVVAPLGIVGWAMWAGDKKFPTGKSLASINLKQAFIIGICQAMALIPGVSRSGSTILGGRIFGFNREDAAKFSFLLGTPAMAGAALLNLPDLLKSLGQGEFYIGCLTATVVGCLSIKFLLTFLRTNGFFAFFVYRVIVALLVITLFWPKT